MTAHSGAQSSAGAMSARNRNVTASLSCSTQVATYCAPASIMPVARPCSTNVREQRAERLAARAARRRPTR